MENINSFNQGVRPMFYNRGRRVKPMSLGDRVFVRVMQSGNKIFENTYDKIGSNTDLISAVRKQMGNYCGLVKIYIRNITRGWSEERPLMFYGDAADRRLYSDLIKINRHVGAAV